MAKAQQGERRRCYAHVADATTPRVVDLIEYEAFLATTGRGHRRGDRRQLEMSEDTRNDRLLSDDGNDTQRDPAAKRTGAHIQPKDAAQQPSPGPVRGARVRFLRVQPLLARGGTDRPTQVAMRRQAAPIAHQVDVRQGDQRRELLQGFQRREPNPSRPVRPRMGEGIDEIAVSVFLEALQGHGPAGRIADEAFQLIAALGWNLRVGMQGKALDAGTARTGEAWR